MTVRTWRVGEVICDLCGATRHFTDVPIGHARDSLVGQGWGNDGKQFDQCPECSKVKP